MGKATFNDKNLLLKYLVKLKDIKVYLNNINDLVNLNSNTINKNLNNEINNLFSANNYRKLLDNLELFGKENLTKIMNIKEEIKEVQIIEDDEIIESYKEPELLEDDPLIIEDDNSTIDLNRIPLTTRKQSINGYLFKDKNSTILGKIKVEKASRLNIYDQKGNKLNIKLEEKEYNIYDYTKDEKNKIKEVRITPDEIVNEQWLQL